MHAILMFFLLFALSNSLEAKTWHVTSDQDPAQLTPGTLRYLIHEAAGNDEIVLGEGIQSITLTQGEILIDKDLLIRGKDVILSGNHVSRLFRIQDKTGVLEGLILTNGYSRGSGGAIYLDHGSLTVRQCLFSGNRAGYGGALFHSIREAYC